MIARIEEAQETESRYARFSVSLGGITASFCKGGSEDRDYHRSRNFEGVYSIRKLMEAAHELGKKGEPLEFEEVDTTPADKE